MRLFKNYLTFDRRLARSRRRLMRTFATGGFWGLAQLAYRTARQSFIDYHAHAAFKTRAAALIGVIGFPLFYFVWAVLIPQPYESVGLRAVGFGLSLLVLATPKLPERVRRHSALISYLTLLYTVPFFFTFMLLMNDASTVSQLALVSGFVYLVLLCDGLNAFILGITGSLAAFGAVWLVTGATSWPADYFHVIPVLAFVLCGVAFLDYSNNLVVTEKMTAIGSLAAHIAHEMRTPLLGIRLDADKLTKVMPDLLDAHAYAKEHGWPGRIPPALRTALPPAVSRIGQHVVSANSVIDMLLMNAAAGRARSELVLCSARRTVGMAIERYNFRSDQRALLDLDIETDFDYLGNELLTTHVLFNLFKNALRAIDKAGRGRISIVLRKGSSGRNEIVFADTGPGMAAEVAAHIFVPFYTNEAIGIGTGIGLSFCRSVIESFDGQISCTSSLGSGTQFVISFPRAIPPGENSIPASSIPTPVS